MPRNEAQTRFELIDPALEDRGWNRRTDIRVEETARPIDIVNHQPRERVAGRTDYVLRRPLTPGAEPVPLAIVEAKHEGLPPEHGLQQGKGYRVGQLHHVPFIFSSNGHLFVEYDEETGTTSDPKPLTEFPTPEELVQRYLAVRGLNPKTPAFKLLEIPYQQGLDYFRYYQDAGMRATFEQIIRAAQDHKPARALLPVATGGGKTRMAAGLLRRICDAGLMGKALFVCDRTELRDNGLGDFQAAFGTDAAEIDTRNPQKNAKVLIATYQTLDHKKRSSPSHQVADEDDIADPDSPPIDATFFLKHYPPGYFDVIVIDECHRSAWGKWFVILEKNSQAIQIGLTATPRQLKLPEVKTGELGKQIQEDRRLLADNLKYFGEPVYEYTYQQGVADGYLAPCEIEQYDIHHDGELTPERIRGVLRADVAAKKLTDLYTGQTLTSDAVPVFNDGSTLEGKLVMPDRVKAMSEHLFERILATGDGSPLQKTIVFCASDHHADLITNVLNGLYSAWAKAHGQKRIQKYAFKCMSSVNGQALIPDFRGRAKSHIIATTKDLLTTGVNVPRVRNIVFFRYVQSPLLFHQMVGRGTRIDRESGKLMFRIFDYTGATALFGEEFVTPPPPEPGPPKPPPPDGPPVQKVRVKGVGIELKSVGNLILHGVDEPHLWHGNTLSGVATYDDLFKGAPQFFDYVLMNPPFGGKEGKEAQTQFEYKTGATQVLFLQHVLKSMKTASKCGIVLDEGVLFRTNETAFVQTKRKLLEECSVGCIVSLPGGVFSSAGAGVKTNLVFFTKGEQTERIWYYDLSDVKVGKKTPLTQAHFDDFFKLLPQQADSPRSWTLDFAARLQKALEEARPHRDQAAALDAQAKQLDDAIKEKKKAKTLNEPQLAALEEECKTVERAARESLAKAESIENAVYDLKAVNPNRASEEDTRTPAELLDFIAAKGQEADAVLIRLRALTTNHQG